MGCTRALLPPRHGPQEAFSRPRCRRLHSTHVFRAPLGESVSPCRRRRCYLSRTRALDGIRRVAEERNVTGPARELGGPMSGRMAAVSPLPGTEDVATELGSGQRRRLFRLRISLARRGPPVPRVRRPSRSSKAHASCIRSSSETWAPRLGPQPGVHISRPRRSESPKQAHWDPNERCPTAGKAHSQGC